jgi:hypothetical protein
MEEFMYGLLIGIIFTVATLLTIVASNNINSACRNSYSNLKEYEKCVDDTDWNNDVTSILKEKLL